MDSRDAPESSVGEGFALSEEQRIQFYRDGYVVIPRAVKRVYFQRALRAINRRLGTGIASEEHDSARRSSYFPDLLDRSLIVNMYTESRARDVARSLVGRDMSLESRGSQIVLRFPGDLCLPNWRDRWHVDGIPAEGGPSPQGEIHNFTLAIGVFLSDIEREMAGNLVVFPGSHHVLERYFQRNGFDVAAHKGLAAMPRLPFVKPRFIRGHAGDIVVLHYQLAHSIAPNLYHEIRYAVYFRINAREERKHHPEPMLNIWADYRDRAMQRTVEAQKKLRPPHVDASTLA